MQPARRRHGRPRTGRTRVICFVVVVLKLVAVVLKEEDAVQQNGLRRSVRLQASLSASLDAGHAAVGAPQCASQRRTRRRRPGARGVDDGVLELAQLAGLFVGQHRAPLEAPPRSAADRVQLSEALQKQIQSAACKLGEGQRRLVALPICGLSVAASEGQA